MKIGINYFVKCIVLLMIVSLNLAHAQAYNGQQITTTGSTLQRLMMDPNTCKISGYGMN